MHLDRETLAHLATFLPIALKEQAADGRKSGALATNFRAAKRAAKARGFTGEVAEALALEVVIGGLATELAALLDSLSARERVATLREAEASDQPRRFAEPGEDGPSTLG